MGLPFTYMYIACLFRGPFLGERSKLFTGMSKSDMVNGLVSGLWASLIRSPWKTWAGDIIIINKYKQQPLLRSPVESPGFLGDIRDMLNWEKQSVLQRAPPFNKTRLEMPSWVYPRPNMTSLELESLISANSRRLWRFFSKVGGVFVVFFDWHHRKIIPELLKTKKWQVGILVKYRNRPVRENDTIN